MRIRTRLTSQLAGATLLVATSACSPANMPFAHHTVTVRGTLELAVGDDPEVPSFMTEPDDPYTCHGVGGYSDITPEATIVIHDPDGKVIATSELGTGESTGFDGGPVPAICRFTIWVTKVPEQKFYGVEVSHRGTVQFTEEQVRAGNVNLTLR